MEPTLPLVVQSVGPLTSLAFIAVGIAVIVLFASRSVGRLLTQLRTETRPIADVEPGRVEVEGTVAPADESRSAHAAWVSAEDPVIAERRRSEGKNRDFTLLIPQQFAPDFLTEQSALPFYVEDDTGRILVDPALADVSLDSDFRRRDDLGGNTRVEAALEPDDTVTVLGQAIPAEEYDRRATRRGGLVRSVYRFFEPDRTPTADQFVDGDDDLVITRTSGSSPFFISDTSSGRGTLRQGLMTVFWVVSGLFVIVAGVYTLVSGLF